MSSPAPGGFLQHQAFSPTPSATASSSSAYALPHPRARPLKAGGPKESAFIRYVDDSILHIQRQFAKRDNEAALGPEDRGYASFGEAAKDIERLLDIIWVSGTPGLQVPYLLSLALLTTTFVSGFPPSPKAMFRLLGKLDRAFASLLQGRDVETGEPLPGSERGAVVSSTQKVRIKSIVERTRLCVIEVMNNKDFDYTTEDEPETGDEDGIDDLDDDVVDGGAGWEMEIAKVYDRTIVELGDAIGGPPIGIFGDE
ncbi:hypothetical protein W97_08245 [Coniosporium apollinis CBS 100218]|uniref:Meiotic recombination protein DMC1 n=1 Tax=Coniosporium apollinis (strain CBS 100218) TaxID=1168221 RepID=R7Z498_CONA1|nr:uncharacterized protein W97_08245 [Coniosporium apollinis CBS 100218]EON68987.1 hypothetical protein W97_08245 [Coniosporium apollinis CBS 100218]